MTVPRRQLDILASVLIGTLLSLSVTLCMLDALDLPLRPWVILAFGAGAAVWCALLVWNRPARCLAFVLGAGAAFCLLRFGDALFHIRSLVRAAAGILAEGEGSLMEGDMALRAILALLFSVIGFGLSRLQGGVYPAATICAAMALIGWRLSFRLTPLYAAPGALSLVLMYANAGEKRTGYWRALPLAAVITAIALICTPLSRPTWQPLSDAAERIRQMFEDYFFFTEARTAYSLAADGYQVMGERLGGPASPREGLVMEVETDEKLLLRGSVRRTYTGVSWSDGGVNSRYLYLDPTRLSTRDSVFSTRFNDFLPGHTRQVSVTFLSDGISTLFVPCRLVDLRLPIEVAAYYNDLGDVFITRGVLEGDRYDMTLFVPEHGDSMRQALLETQGREDRGYDNAQNGYLALPRGISQRVYALAEEITKDAPTPYDAALAIRDHLLRNYRYNPEVDYPPVNRDFVSWFLLDAREGYCSYFATAMTVLCRMAGLPARYVEGYQVTPNDTGVTQVRGSDAHAWVEVYFSGAGWLPFDPTPGYDWTAPDGPSPMPTPQPEGEDDQGQDDQSQEPEPTPTPEPDGGEPTPEPESDEEEQSEPTPPPEEPHSSPTPPPEPPENIDPPTTPPDPPRRHFPWWLVILLALLFAGVLLWRRLTATDPFRRARRLRDGDSQLMYWYLTLNRMLQICGFTPSSGQTPASFAEALKGSGPWSGDYTAFIQALCQRRYGGRKPAQEDVRLAQTAYRSLWRSMTRSQKLRAILDRLFRPLPDLKHVP